ncbi:MAG: histidine phosphatase family protein [Verrucomicrobiales bacterium]|nr:histidine phosphatase family protein [Verrucomicrobiales bacterium]
MNADAITRLFLIRHGEVEARYQRVFGGRLDIGLSPRGQEQAEALATYLDGLHFDAVLVSPQRRAQLTAQPLLALNGHQPVPEPDLREIDFGEWTGLAWEEVRERHGKSAYNWLEEIVTGGMAGAEPAAAIVGRVNGVLQRLRVERPGQRVALVCHGGVVRAALAALLDLPLTVTAGFEVDYASVTIVDWKPRRAEIQLLNYTPWRRR